MRQKIRKGVAAVLMVLLGLLAGAAIGWCAASQLDRLSGPVWLRAALVLGAVIAAYFIQVVVHEGGHLVCGLLSGYRFLSFRIGSFLWVKQEGRLVFRRFELPGTGGQCLMVPPEGQDAPQMLYNLGGGLANLLLSALAGLLMLAVDGAAAVFLAALVLMGVVTALTNLIPMRMGSVANDGYNAWSLGRSDQGRRAFLTQLWINGLVAQGIPLSQAPEEWFQLPRDADWTNPLVCSTAYLSISRLLDLGDIPAAEGEIRTLLERGTGMLGLHRRGLECDLLYCELVGQNRPQERERLRTKEMESYIKSTRKYFPSVVRTLYAWALLADRDEGQAQELEQEFEKAARHYPYPVELEGERRLMEKARRRAEETAQ